MSKGLGGPDVRVCCLEYTSFCLGLALLWTAVLAKYPLAKSPKFWGWQCNWRFSFTYSYKGLLEIPCRACLTHGLALGTLWNCGKRVQYTIARPFFWRRQLCQAQLLRMHLQLREPYLLQFLFVVFKKQEDLRLFSKSEAHTGRTCPGGHFHLLKNNYGNSS